MKSITVIDCTINTEDKREREREREKFAEGEETLRIDTLKHSIEREREIERERRQLKAIEFWLLN